VTFARVTSLRFDPERAVEAFFLVAQSIVPTIKGQQGCQGVLLLREPSGDATTVTLWASEADMAAAASANYPVQIEKLDGMLREPPSRRTYEVAELAVTPVARVPKNGPGLGATDPVSHRSELTTPLTPTIT
jgi:hypothetical protein